jgi:hypothetical protein
MPDEALAIRKRLVTLSQDSASIHADLLELLVRFDDLAGWKSVGATHCAAWMNLELGISIQMGWEYLRVGRKLRTLPTTSALFKVGKLSWSKVRLISRVATKDNERLLCHSALDASVSDVERLCKGYRWSDDKDDSDDDANGENARAMRQWEGRALVYSMNSNGSTSIRLTLPPEQAKVFLNSIEHSVNQIAADHIAHDQSARSNASNPCDRPATSDPSDPSDKSDRSTKSNQSDHADHADQTDQVLTNETTLTQRRADAAVLMAENSLQYAGRDNATADRYQVIVSVDEAALKQSPTSLKKPALQGGQPIATETARRLACDCSITTQRVTQGERMSIGRKSRVWTVPITRAIKERDQHCQFPGCTCTDHLQIHHIKHWADGGETSVANGVTLCSTHHRYVHEGGYSIERVEDSRTGVDEQFEQQQHKDDVSQFNFESDLRGNRSSFDTVRHLSPPERFRFRVLDRKGRVFNGLYAFAKNAYTSPEGKSYATTGSNYTRVECAEPVADYHYQVDSSCQIGSMNSRAMNSHGLALGKFTTLVNCQRYLQ